MSKVTADAEFDDWITRQRQFAIAGILRCISRTDLVHERRRFGEVIRPAPGSIIASICPGEYDPEPDYFFDWLRDSAIILDVMRCLAETGERSADWTVLFGQAVSFALRLLDLDGADLAGGAWRERVLPEVAIYLRPDEELRQVSGGRLLADVRFSPDGTLDIRQWARPQTDGPAQQALTLLRWRRSGLPFGDELRAAIERLIVTDLDFVLTRRNEASFDLWEERSGFHYHTRLLQHAALAEGSEWAVAMADSDRAERYRAAAQELLAQLDAHWQRDGRHYAAHDEHPFTPDSAIVLAVLHAARPAGPHSILDPRVEATVASLEAVFTDQYAINRHRPDGYGVAFGRHSSDVYFGGGAFFCTTLAVAEFWYRRARAHLDGRVPAGPDSSPIAQASGDHDSSAAELIGRGDAILRTVRRFAPPYGTLPEQIDQNTGAPASAKDLAWSHAAFLTATDARASARGSD